MPKRPFPPTSLSKTSSYITFPSASIAAKLLFRLRLLPALLPPKPRSSGNRPYWRPRWQKYTCLYPARWLDSQANSIKTGEGNRLIEQASLLAFTIMPSTCKIGLPGLIPLGSGVTPLVIRPEIGARVGSARPATRNAASPGEGFRCLWYQMTGQHRGESELLAAR